jgi:hypothetical protein
MGAIVGRNAGRQGGDAGIAKCSLRAAPRPEFNELQIALGN